MGKVTSKFIYGENYLLLADNGGTLTKYLTGGGSITNSGWIYFAGWILKKNIDAPL